MAKNVLDETLIKVTDSEIELEKAMVNVKTALIKYNEVKKTVIEVEKALKEAKTIDRNDPNSYIEYLSVKELKEKLNAAKADLKDVEETLFHAKENVLIAQMAYDKADKEYVQALVNYNILRNAENKTETDKSEEIPSGNLAIVETVKKSTLYSNTDDSPQTSDDSNLVPSVLGMMSALVLAGVAIRKKERHRI